MKQRLHTVIEHIRKNPLLLYLPGMGWNLSFALINGLLGLIYGSYWYQTLFALYLILGLMKLSVLTLKRSKRRSESDMLLHTGLAMFLLAFIVIGLIVLTIREDHTTAMNKGVMVITAAFTFVFVGITIVNTVKAYKRRTPVLIALRNISCAGALLSLLSLERSMIGTFGKVNDGSERLIHSYCGAMAFLVLLGLGLNLLRLFYRARKEFH